MFGETIARIKHSFDKPPPEPASTPQPHYAQTRDLMTKPQDLVHRYRLPSP